MLKGILKVAFVGLVYLNAAAVYASPIGLYIKPAGTYYWGGKSNRNLHRVVLIVHGAWQPSRTRLLELVWATPATNIQDSSVPGTQEAEKNARTHLVSAFGFISKHLIPLKHDCSVYTQWGFFAKTSLGFHAPFWGVGVIWDCTRRVNIDFSYRNFSLLRELTPNASPKSRSHSVILSFAYHLR